MTVYQIDDGEAITVVYNVAHSRQRLPPHRRPEPFHTYHTIPTNPQRPIERHPLLNAKYAREAEKFR